MLFIYVIYICCSNFNPISFFRFNNRKIFHYRISSHHKTWKSLSGYLLIRFLFYEWIICIPFYGLLSFMFLSITSRETILYTFLMSSLSIIRWKNLHLNKNLFHAPYKYYTKIQQATWVEISNLGYKICV